jgi:hypothetical protein
MRDARSTASSLMNNAARVCLELEWLIVSARTAREQEERFVSGLACKSTLTFPLMPREYGEWLSASVRVCVFVMVFLLIGRLVCEMMKKNWMAFLEIEIWVIFFILNIG